MKKLLTVLLISFLLTGCALQPDSNIENQDSIDKIKQEVKNELLQELQNDYRNSLSDTEKAITDMVKLQANAVLGVSNFQYNESNKLYEVGTGSGVVYKTDNNQYYLVTNHHVVDEAEEIQVVLPGAEYIKASLIGSDEVSDLAVLKFSYDGYLPTVAFGNFDDLVMGQFVIAIGNPLGYDYYRSITLGVLSGFPSGMYLDNSEWEVLLQHDAAINPGNSGGALFDIKGNLIGINNMKIVQENVNGIGFAIPIHTVEEIIAKLELNGTISRPQLGISGGEVSYVINSPDIVLPDNVTYGIYISEVRENTGAAKAGLEIGDVIIEANGVQINAFEDLKTIINESNVGDKLTIKVNRNGDVLGFEVTLTER